MISINHCTSVLKAQNNLNKANNAMNTALQRMSTGYKINTASDDAAGLYIATSLNTQISGLKQVQKNAEDGKNVLSIAEGSLRNMTNMLTRVRDLALQGANSYYSDDSRNAIQCEADKLIEEISRVRAGSNYNGINVFDPAAIHNAEVPEGYTAIYSAEDLNKIRDNLSGKYILMNDINLGSIDNWAPIGNNSNKFAGILDGNGYKIKNLNIDDNTTSYIGLFGYTANSAEIKNIGLENVNTKSTKTVGSLAGYNTGTISNCYSTGSVNCDGTGIAGGLTGSNSGTISNCHSSVKISTKSTGGGLVGYASTNSNISDCYSTGSVTSNKTDGTGDLGGLVGSSSSSTTFTNCYSTSVVTGGNRTGGLIGTGYDFTITNCYATGKVTGKDYVGGLVGECSSGTNITNCYSIGSVAGGKSKGGLVGNAMQSTINNCYTTSNVQKENASDKLGVLIGETNNTTVTNVFGNNSKSKINDIFGSGTLNAGSSNYRVMDSSEFKSAGNWTSYSDSIWDKSTYPPKLKKEEEEYTDNIRLQVGSNSDFDANAIYLNTVFELNDLYVDFFDTESCLEAVETVDKILKEINDKMAYIGAAQNKLYSVGESQVTQKENFSEAKSTIIDADIAKESAEYTKQQIFRQSAGALLVQANNLNANTAISLINAIR